MALHIFCYNYSCIYRFRCMLPNGITWEGKKAIRFSGEHALTWMGEEFVTEDGRPIGIGGDPRGATAEKGRIILETSAREPVPAFLEIRDWK